MDGLPVESVTAEVVVLVLVLLIVVVRLLLLPLLLLRLLVFVHVAEVPGDGDVHSWVAPVDAQYDRLVEE